MESNGYTHSESLLEPLAHINREHLAAMADAAVADQHDFHQSSPSSPGHKRKRGGQDSSPDMRRAKRVVPPAPISDTPDAAYVESAVEAAQAAAQAATNADFTALQQAAANHHDPSSHANASSTAAAALGTMYPTIHVPQPTEETFAAQTAGDVDHHEHPFSHPDLMHQPDGLPDATSQTPQNGVRGAQPSYGSTPTTSSKPAVGSEEWHKMRKDNHKEGQLQFYCTANET